MSSKLTIAIGLAALALSLPLAAQTSSPKGNPCEETSVFTGGTNLGATAGQNFVPSSKVSPEPRSFVAPPPLSSIQPSSIVRPCEIQPNSVFNPGLSQYTPQYFQWAVVNPGQEVESALITWADRLPQFPDGIGTVVVMEWEFKNGALPEEQLPSRLRLSLEGQIGGRPDRIIARYEVPAGSGLYEIYSMQSWALDLVTDPAPAMNVVQTTWSPGTQLIVLSMRGQEMSFSLGVGVRPTLIRKGIIAAGTERGSRPLGVESLSVSQTHLPY